MQKKHKNSGVKGLIASVLAAVMLCGVAMPLAVYGTANRNELQENVDDARSEYMNESSALSDAKKETQNAQKEVNKLTQQSKVLLEQIAAIEADIEVLNQQIAEKENEIAAKQAEIDARWEAFKQRMGAMQELNDNGAMTMLSAVQNLYQFLTFGEVLQDISIKDHQELREMQQLKVDLENAKADLEATKAELERQKALLEEKKAELAKSLQRANQTLSDAKAAQQAQQIVTDAAREKWTQAQEELDAYIKENLDQAGDGGLSCGMNFQAALPYYTRISTYFGVKDAWHSKPHGGTDYAAPKNTPIYATESGTVTIARYSSSYGNYVTINHGRGTDGNVYATLYAHMTSYCVTVGQYVSKGQIIGYVGSTGRSSGNHLHLELWRNSVKIDSRLLIPDR